MSVGECVASDDSGNGAYGKGLDGVYMEIAFRARRCSIPVASLHTPETGKRLLVAALRAFGKLSWRFDISSNRQFLFCGVVSTNPRKSFVWHWIASIVNSVRLSMYPNHNLDLGFTVVTSSDDRTNIIIFVPIAVSRFNRELWLQLCFWC